MLPLFLSAVVVAGTNKGVEVAKLVFKDAPYRALITSFHARPCVFRGCSSRYPERGVTHYGAAPCLCLAVITAAIIASSCRVGTNEGPSAPLVCWSDASGLRLRQGRGGGTHFFVDSCFTDNKNPQIHKKSPQFDHIHILKIVFMC